jgi:signal peptidase II
MRFLLYLTLPLYALDQLTKWLVVRNIEPGFDHPLVMIPGFFDLVNVTNTGAAFSVFSNNNVFFILLSAIVLVALVFFYSRGAFNGKMLRTGFALLMAGILGNLTDRILHSHVIDFLVFDFHVKFADPWPAFNVADSCICVAAGIFIITSFRDEKKRAPQG